MDRFYPGGEAVMIPTVEDILKGLQLGIVSMADARRWMEQHLEMAKQRGYQMAAEAHEVEIRG